MTPRASTATKQQHQHSTESPFDRIAEREKQEELRLQEAIEKLQAERIDAAKGMADAEKHAEEKLREEEMKKLSDCKEEIGKDLEKHEADIKEDLKTIESSYKKNSTGLVQKQAEALLSLSI